MATMDANVAAAFPLGISDSVDFIMQGACAEELNPPVVIVSNALDEDDDDELLFEPDSPGTPPTPEQKKRGWASRQSAGTIVGPLPPPCSPASSPPPPSPLMSSPESSMMSLYDGDHEERVSSVDSCLPPTSDRSPASSSSMESYGPLPTLNLNATLRAVKDTTQKVAAQPREVISRFQLKGGLVGWLHGESNDTNPSSEMAEAARVPTHRASIAGDGRGPPTRQRGSSLFGNLYDKMKQKQEQLELKLQALDEPSRYADRIPSHESSALRSMPRARLSLQPSVVRKFDGVDIDADDRIGFDSFVNPAATSQPLLRCESRLRSVSSGESYQSKESKSAHTRLRSLTFAARPSKSLGETSAMASSTPTSSSTSALQWDAFSMDDCLADPKLAAEFVNAVLPGDEWILTLLYSIEEYEMLTSSPSAVAADDSAAPLEAQMLMALTITDRFLVASTNRSVPSRLEALGKEIRATVAQYQQRPSECLAASDSVAAAIAAQATALPMTLFDNVYTWVFDHLRDAFDSKFRLTREFAQLQVHYLQQQQIKMKLNDERSLQHLVLTFDQVIESEWCSTVFWVYLFRTTHHHRLSFIMDVKFKLRRLHLTAQQAEPRSPEASKACKRLMDEVLLICRRFLTTKTAALALPTTSPMLSRLKDELCMGALALERSAAPELAFLRDMIDKLDAMRTQTRVDFKRMSFERFASFLTSPLYRDFIVHPSSASSTHCSRADDLMRLLRVNRIPFHQTAVSPPCTRDLRKLSHLPTETVFNRAVATTLSFRSSVDPQTPNLHEYRPLHTSTLENETSLASLTKIVDSFLLPASGAAVHKGSDNRSSFCFNFVAGTGESTVYGAVWQLTKQQCEHTGVCVLSRYPLVDGLREYLYTLASEISRADSIVDVFPPTEGNPPATLEAGLAAAKAAFAAHCHQLCNDPGPVSELPLLDSSLQDLFECLSITHTMRLFSLVVQEKKIVMISSSYSVLLSVGEALRAIISPLVWSHIYVPVLPLAMKGYLHCPTPFIFGLHTSYAYHCELPKPSDELAVVNLDRDSITGGGEVYIPPQRVNVLRQQLTALYKQRLRTRDHISFRFSQSASSPFAQFPSRELREVFQNELGDILRHLQTFVFRFECVDRTIAVVDTSNKSRQWPTDAARFYSALLQTQAFSTYLGRNDN